jgi:dTDP-4-amino-4,6-dideoxygalactose transaminase
MDMKLPNMVPQTDPGASYFADQVELDAAVRRVMQSGRFILGAEGAAFETEFADWLGAGEAVGCGNGTDALVLALRGLGIGAGDAVATVSHTAVATVAAIEMADGLPVLIDIEPETYTMNPADLEAVLVKPPPGCPPVRAVIVVHIYGQAAALDEILALAARHGVAVIEDCAQAHGATHGGRKLGTFGDAAAFSFYPTKNLGAFGDAGAVATRDAALAARLRALRQYGWRLRYVSDVPGINSRLDETQAAVLRVKLQTLDAGNARRREIAAAYDAALAGTGIAPPRRRPGCAHVFHQYVVQLDERDEVQRILAEQGVGTGIHYPVPVHLQPAYADRLPMGPMGCRETALAAGRILSLPMYPELRDAQLEQVCAALRRL